MVPRLAESVQPSHCDPMYRPLLCCYEKLWEITTLPSDPMLPRSRRPLLNSSRIEAQLVRTPSAACIPSIHSRPCSFRRTGTNDVNYQLAQMTFSLLRPLEGQEMPCPARANTAGQDTFDMLYHSVPVLSHVGPASKKQTTHHHT